MLPFIDIHAHFPMHEPFPPLPSGNPAEDLRKKVEFDVANQAFNYENGKPRVSLENWFADQSEAAVSGFGSVLFDPEDDFFVSTAPRPEAICHVLKQLDDVEAEIAKDGRVTIAKNPGMVERCINQKQKFIFHTVEGGFAIGGDPANVDKLAARGVASIVPAHLFFRSVATCENAFPAPFDEIFKHEIDSQPKNVGLTRDIGIPMVERMMNAGVIVDITHATERAQNDIFAIARDYGRPVISSHNSVRAIADYGLNLSDAAILSIKDSGGMIGVIYFRHWLQRRDQPDDRDDFDLIFDVIDHIRQVTGSHDYAGIGSDLDGFIDPIQTCSNYSKMSAMGKAILARYGGDAERILWRNALRVLQAGWTGVTERAEGA
jgi:membrane dipeptidase